MRPLLQHASRSVLANAARPVQLHPSRAFGRLVSSASRTPSACRQCQLQSSSLALHRRPRVALYQFSRRQLSATGVLREEKKPPGPPEPSFETQPSQNAIELPPPPPPEPTEPKQPEKEEEVASKPPSSDPASTEPIELPPPKDGDIPLTELKSPPKPQDEKVVDNIARVPAEDLPSHREAQRWDFSKRFTELMDELLPKLAVVTQKVNTYTGTDYSGIEALRKEIKEQEKLVKARRLAIEEAKEALDAAHAQQASSQKEVVALLERKHSWSAADLERYMSLIRSEHVNDQAVREAKEAVSTAENALEESRTQLERRERAQYHEEQIWSDTIRRNSTWVTFGLMGLNIFLLLLSLIVLEPWRRRRMVREIKNALEAHKVATEAVPAVVPAVAPSVAAPVVEAEIKKAPEPVSTQPERDQTVETAIPQPLPNEAEEAKIESIPLEDIVPNDAGPDTAPDAAVPGAAPLTLEGLDPQQSIDIEEEIKARTPLEYWQRRISAEAQDLLSEKTISIRKIDLTTVIAQSAAAGAFITGALIVLLRSN